MKKKARFNGFARLGALCALPLLWSPAAEAGFIACSAEDGNTFAGLFSYGQATHSLQCEGEGMTLRAQARNTTSNMGIQVRLYSNSGATSPGATALGYNFAQQFVPGCAIVDTTPGTSWSTVNCTETIQTLVIYVSGEQ